MITASHACFPGCLPCDGCCDCGPGDPEILTARRWAWRLTVLTIAWNCLEVLVALVSGYLAGSVALVGFGLDSAVEVSSALVVVWWLSRQRRAEPGDEATERRAVRLIALSFFGLAAYIAVEAGAALLGLDEAPRHSGVGLALVALSLFVMPALAWAKRRVARALGSMALGADAAETQLCFYLSAVVLLGLAANQLWAWWWADALAGLFVAGIAVKEGRAAWSNGDLCADDPIPGVTAAVSLHCVDSCCPVCPVAAA